MKIRIDAQFSPSIALWLNQTFPQVTAHSLRYLGLRDAEDETIFLAAREHNAILMTKDADMVKLLERLGPPPQIVWITTGNTSNHQMRGILSKHFVTIVSLINNKETCIEIGNL